MRFPEFGIRRALLSDIALRKEWAWILAGGSWEGKHRLRWTDGLDYARNSGVMMLAHLRARRHKGLGVSSGQCPAEISVAIPLPPGSPFVYPLLGRGLEELGDSVWLPRSFMVPNTSCDFYFGTHKGQSQPLPAGMTRRMQEAAGFPSLLGPTNREARTSNPSSTGVDINSRAEPQGAAPCESPVSPKWGEIQLLTAHSEPCPPPTFSITQPMAELS